MLFLWMHHSSCSVAIHRYCGWSCSQRLLPYKTQTLVIFDQYENISAKDHERQRRAGGGSTEYNLTLTTVLPGREIIMKNKRNKQRLGELLCTNDLGEHIQLVNKADSFVTNEEADISMISHMLDALKNGATTIRILCDDTDVFVLMVYWCWKTGTTCHLQMGKWDGKILDINHTVQTLGEKCSSILAIYVLSGCDTTSYPAGKGKVSALRALHATPSEVLHYVREENATYTNHRSC